MQFFGSVLANFFRHWVIKEQCWVGGCLFLLLVLFSVQLLPLLCAEMNRKSCDECWLVGGMS